MIKFTILMLTHNRLEIAERCFKSLVSTLERTDVRCLVVDNASTDGTRDYLPGMAGGKHHTFLMDSNLGVAGGRAKLLELAEMQNDVLRDGYYVFLDSDTVIMNKGWLDDLGGVLDKNENVGLVGPGGSFVKRDWSGFEAAIPNAECDVVAGYVQCFRRSLLDLGLHMESERYKGFWTEDSSFALQIRALDYDVYCKPISVFHEPSHSGYGQQEGLHEAHIALFREQWRGKGLTKAEGAY